MDLQWIEEKEYSILIRPSDAAPSKVWIYHAGDWVDRIEIWSETTRGWAVLPRPDLSPDDLKAWAAMMYRMQVEP